MMRVARKSRIAALRTCVVRSPHYPPVCVVKLCPSSRSLKQSVVATRAMIIMPLLTWSTNAAHRLGTGKGHDNHGDEGRQLRAALASMVNRTSVPQVFVKGNHVGGCDDTVRALNDGTFMSLLGRDLATYDYDLVVIGGGSGGLAASKMAASLGKNVAVLDYVKPTPLGTTWGLGGTCVNVGCIPKKLMHTAGLLGQSIKDAAKYGWKLPKEGHDNHAEVEHNWTTMKDAVVNYIRSLNWNYKVDLRTKQVKYINSYGVFMTPNKIKVDVGSLIQLCVWQAINKKGKEEQITARHFLVATGERPRYPDIPGAREYCITSKGPLQGYGGAVSVLMLESAAKVSASMLGTASNYRQSQTFTKECLDHVGVWGSDDLFYLDYCPGKTLVIGASYVALECAGFLHGLGLDVTVMVRSIFLRGFDQDMADRVGKSMEEEGVKFVRPCVPTEVRSSQPPWWWDPPVVQEKSGSPGLYTVRGVMQDSKQEFCDTFNTAMIIMQFDFAHTNVPEPCLVILAIGRDPCTADIGLEEIGTSRNGCVVPRNKRVVVHEEKTSVDNIYAIGDIIDGGLQLTPVAIQAGILLAKRLYGQSKENCDYTNVPTTVFTPLEYGSIGLAEEDAIHQYGEENIRVYHSTFTPLEYTVAARSGKHCYAKLVCLKTENERVLGFHYLGPNAGEVTQGFAVGIKMGATKSIFDQTIGIHPTCAEMLVVVSCPWSRSDQSVHPDHNTGQQRCLVHMDVLFWVDVCHIEGCKDGWIYMVRTIHYADGHQRERRGLGAERLLRLSPAARTSTQAAGGDLPEL
ncbi:TXNRD3 [Cordylochernes scorpioides]|uniref:TXNRD3 n=1 Tax=Cordylochernes scorpioides TaxID=51811 RepID=A0ABY6K9N9_9ARAC|nr:TXNRD3 [Cordylochernes scorpioides]